MGVTWATIGYGYRPWRALKWMAGFVVVGAILFGASYEAGFLAPNLSGFTPPFNAVIYAIDTFIPVIDLKQADAWLPIRSWLWAYWWLHTAAGWVLTSLLAVGLSGLVRR